MCKEMYIGQTCTTFAKRWNLHRQDWKKMTNLESGKYEITDNNDDKALFFHYVQFHKTIIAKKPDLWEAYELTFAEQPSKARLDTAENCWIEKVDASINKAKTCLPKFK